MKSFELISKITLSTLNISDFDIQMNTILEILGQYTQVSRAYIFIDNEDGRTTSNKYEWCNTGIEAQIHELQEFPYEIIPSWRKLLLENGKIFSDNILDLPKDITAMLQPQGIKSVVAYPIIILNKVKGFVGFDECTINRKWDESELNILSSVSSIISNRYESHLYQKNILKEQEALQKFTKLFENNPALMAVSSIPERKFIDVNKSFIEKIGYSYDEIIGKKSSDLGLFPQVEKVEEVADSFQKHGKIHNIELQVRCKNNEILDGLFSGEIIESQGKIFFNCNG